MSDYEPPKLIQLVSEDDYSVGLSTAPVTVVEYGDYECIHCGYFHQIISQVLHQLGTTRIRYVFRHFPLTKQHPHSRRAAQAAEAAAEQGKFWQMHNLLFDNQNHLTDDDLLSYAERLQLDLEQFKQDMESEEIKERIDTDIRNGVKSGVNGTPTLFVNDIRYDGAWDINSIMEFIDKPVGLKIQLVTQRFTQLAVSGGILLFIFTIAALLWSNSNFQDEYFSLWKSYFILQFGDFVFQETFVHMVNDGLMVFFFFVVGLEIKREIMIGELSDKRKAMMPIIAALGGMFVPAGIYVLVNIGNPAGLKGWGIPMATDIAFMLVILTFLSNRIPVSLRIFFSALAIVDDLGAILVISIFYTNTLNTMYLLYAAIIFVVLVFMNRARIYSVLPYAILGILLWYMFLESGIHPTIAGVLLALTIPTRDPPDTKGLIAQCNTLMIQESYTPDNEEEMRHSVLQTLETITDRLQSPAQRLEHDVQPWTTWLILPIFALANAGISLEGYTLSSLTNSITLGIILGLIIGKPLGIMIFAWLGVRLGIAQLPGQVGWKQIFAISWLTGIGFTMSLFIASIAYETDEVLLAEAKVGILLASLLATVVGLVLGFRVTEPIGQSHSAL